MTVSVRDLRVGEMIAISASWVGEQKATFLSIPEVASLYDRMETAHQALLASRDGASNDATLASLGAKADRLDARHDDLNRALYHLLLAAKYAELGREGGDDERAAALGRTHRVLFPTGLNIVLASYQTEAGTAAQLSNLATKEFASLLNDVCVDKTMTALDIAHAIGSVGAELGSVEQQRSLAAAAAEQGTITPAEVRRRMRDWSQIAEVVLSNLELSSAPKAKIEVLRQPLVDAAMNATDRRREKRTKQEEKPSAPGVPKYVIAIPDPPKES